MAADAAQGLPGIVNRRGKYTTGRRESHATQAPHPTAIIADSQAGAPSSADVLSTAQAFLQSQETHPSVLDTSIQTDSLETKGASHALPSIC